MGNGGVSGRKVLRHGFGRGMLGAMLGGGLFCHFLELAVTKTVVARAFDGSGVENFYLS